jgi:hypothetical protein
MAGGGVLPARAAAEARRQGWRVVAFAFAEAPGLARASDAIVPSRLTDLQAVLLELGQRRVEAVLFVGKFGKEMVFAHAGDADEAGHRLAARGFSDAALAETVVTTLAAMGIEVLDQRPFLGDRLLGDGALTPRRPSEPEWEEIRAGLALARRLARFGIGQTVVRARGVTVAVEAAEGTDETIRRGTRLAGPGAVVVKAVADGHDYRFDIPTIGPATVEAMASGKASALAVERDRVLVVDPDVVVRLAADASITIVGVAHADADG